MKTKFSWLYVSILLALLLTLPGCAVGQQVSSAVGSLNNRIKLVGDSMAPAIKDGQTITFAAVSPADLKRGDVVVFQNGDTKAVKRLVGMPGETVEIREGKVYINDQVLDEPYVSNPKTETTEKIALAGDEYYVLGDNRGMSNDSRAFGPVKAGAILGRVTLTP